MDAGANPQSRLLGARPGFLLVYRGAELGIVERVEVDAHDGTEQVHVRGGIAGGLAYTVPVTAIAIVDRHARRAVVDGSVTFVADPTVGDELVRMSARIDPARAAVPDCGVAVRVGSAVRATDGRLGFVESISRADDGTPRSVIVRGRRRMRTRRFEIPAALLRASGRARHELVIETPRRELRPR